MSRTGIAIAVLAVAAVTVLGAQTLEPQQQDVQLELVQLNATMLEIRDVLAQQLESDSLDLLLKRSELVSSDVARIEARLRNAQEQRRSLSDDQERMRTQIEAVAEYTGYLRQMEFEVERTQRRIRDLDGEIQELQNRLTAKQRDLRSWQDIVDRRLGGV